MSDSPTDDSDLQPFPLRFSFRAFFLVFTVAAIALPLMEFGIPHLTAFLTAPVSTCVYLAKWKHQPADLVIVVSGFFSAIMWRIVAFYAACYAVLVEYDYVLSHGNPFLKALILTFFGGGFGAVVGLWGLMIRDGVQKWNGHGETTKR